MKVLPVISFVVAATALAIACAAPVRAQSAPSVRLNEIVSENKSWTNYQGHAADWIEIYNTGTAAADLSDMSLTDQPGSPRRWVFPAGTLVAPGGFLVVFCDGTVPASAVVGDSLNAGFGLKSSGGAVYLFRSLAERGALMDAVVYGLQLADFGIGRETDGVAWNLTWPTPGAANERVVLGNPATLRVNEWMANPSSGDDYLELYNPDPLPVALGGLFLTDNLTNRTQYRIPALSFIGADGAGYALFSADNNPNKGADHTNFKLNGGGEAVGLFAADGVTMIDGITFGPQRTGVSEGRFPDGSTNIVPLVDNPTPGKGNFYALDGIVINEILSHADDPFEDAFELYNPTARSIDLSGWYVSDNINKPKKFRMPAGTVIEPGGYTVIYRYQFQPQPGIFPSFAFSSAHGDELYLFTADGSGTLNGYRAGVVFPPAPNNIPFGRYLTSIGPQFVLVERVQMGANVLGTDPENLLPLFRTGRGAPNARPVVGPVVISEIMYHPPDFGTNDNALDEFVELRNIVSTNVPFFDPVYPSNHWSLHGAVDYTFTNDVWLAASSPLLVVNFDPVTNATQLAEFRARFQVSSDVCIYGPYRGKLNNNGESLELIRPDIPQFCFDPDFGWVPPILVDKIDYADSDPWPSAADGTGYSLQRWSDDAFGNDPVNWYAGPPTAGARNGPPADAIPVLQGLEPAYSVGAGSNITLAVAASGVSNSFHWSFQGAFLPSATNAWLAIAGAQPTNAGRYGVLVSNPYGAAAAACQLQVVAPPVITGQPRDQNVPNGGTAIFLVTLEGTPPFRYQWRTGGSAILGATNATLVLSNVQPADAGDFSVTIATEDGDTASAVATLTVSSGNAPSFVAAPTGAYFRAVTAVAAGSSFVLGAVAAGDPPLAYQWIKDGIDILDATNATFTVPAYQAADDGSYQLEVRNALGTALSEPVALTLLLPPQVNILGATSFSRNEGDSLVLHAAATGTERLYYQWQVDGRNLIGELCNTVVIPQLSFTNAGSYRVVVTGPGGLVTSSSVEVSIRPRILSISADGSQVRVTFTGTPLRSYLLYCSTNLIDWLPVAPVLQGTGPLTLIQSDPPPPPLFYRIEQVP